MVNVAISVPRRKFIHFLPAADLVRFLSMRARPISRTLSTRGGQMIARRAGLVARQQLAHAKGFVT
jgi:hypothetical protein